MNHEVTIVRRPYDQVRPICTCGWLGTTCRSVADAEIEAAAHTAPRKGTLNCQYCNRAFKWHNTLQRHEQLDCLKRPKPVSTLAPHITIIEVTEATYSGRGDFYSGIKSGERVQLVRETTEYNFRGDRKSSVGYSVRALDGNSPSLSISFGEITGPIVYWRLKSVSELVEFGVSRDVTLAYASGLEAGKRAGRYAKAEIGSSPLVTEAACFAGAEEHGDRGAVYVHGFGAGYREVVAS